MAKRISAKARRIKSLATRCRNTLQEARSKYRAAGEMLTQLREEAGVDQLIDMDDGGGVRVKDRFGDASYVRDTVFVNRYELEIIPPPP